MSKRSGTSKLQFLKKLPTQVSGITEITDPAHTLLIYDRILERISPEFMIFANRFEARYAVKSGEPLKDLDAFPGHVSRLAHLTQSLAPRKMTILAVGGGSVGDFAGFIASVYKRGVRLVHMPTTWLAAIDSSHGGKTALNVTGVKNVIGTFYPADLVVLVRSLLLLQPETRINEAFGELAKIAIIDGGSWVKKLEKERTEGADLLWKYLEPAIEAKMKVVKKDPTESKGHRQILNLGHTFGHALEAHYGWSHGEAVAQGLFFALDYSEAEGLLKPGAAHKARLLMTEILGLGKAIPLKSMPAGKLSALVSQDKKRAAHGEVTFIFPRAFGKVERKPIAISDLVAEARRQGYVSGADA